MNPEVRVNMMNVIMTLGARERTMNEEEAMMYNSFCDCLKAQADLEAVMARSELKKAVDPPPSDDGGETEGHQPEQAPC